MTGVTIHATATGRVAVRFEDEVPDGSDGFVMSPESARELAANLIAAADRATALHS